MKQQSPIKITDTISTVELNIESVAFGGKGVSRLDGKVYFVNDVIEGDIVKALVVEEGKRYVEAELVEIIKPSPYRGTSECPYSVECGGCQWQGVDYQKQLEWKCGFVTSALTRIGKINSDFNIPINKSESAFNYRNRILLRCYIDNINNIGEKSNISFGYFKRSSRELVPIDTCKNASSSINNLLHLIKTSLHTHLPEQKLRMELQEIPVNGTNISQANFSTDGLTSDQFFSSGIAIVLYPTEGEKQDLAKLKDYLNRLPGVLWVGSVFDLEDAPIFAFEETSNIPSFPEERERIVFSTSPGMFQQVNINLNGKLRQLVTQYVKSKNPSKILDLFCGSGNLSLMLSDQNRYIEGIETNRSSIKCAQFNVAINNIQNSQYFRGDTEAHLWKCAKKGESFDLVLTDPPREGMYKGIIPLLKIFPKNIVYVSCDPATLARDLGSLCNKGYKIEKIEAFDFFPNTYHVETAVFLERN